MKIGIDARLIQETGIGRYIENLLRILAVIDTENDYVVYLPVTEKIQTDYFRNNWKIVRTSVRWHTFAEQVVMPILYYRDKLDLLHVPYHNIPIFYSKPFIVTMHDLIVLHFDTGKASTLPYPLYKIRRLGYWLALAIGLRKAQKIIAVSESTKAEIMNHFGIPADKIEVIYEGIDALVISHTKSTPLLNEEYFLYVGNAYPHKNLDILIKAFGQLISILQNEQQTHILPKLVLVGSRNYFYDRLIKDTSHLSFHSRIVFYGDAANSELALLYKHARALVIPSLMEGFGFPPLEALVNGITVIVSDIPVFHEILGDIPLYFKPTDTQELVDKMFFVWKNKKSFQKKLSASGVLLNRYRWDTAGRATIRCYIQSLRG